MNRITFVSVRLAAGVILTSPTIAHAHVTHLDTQESQPIRTRVQTTRSALLNERLAREWHLTSGEWTRYQQLMQGPLGIWSPHLDPLTALGIDARSDAERAHYAALEVRMEGERVAKILAYQRAYDAAWKRLYPNLKPVNFPSATSVRIPEGNGRLAVFVKEPCPACVEAVRSLQAKGRTFDIYMVGLETDTEIRTWAARVGIDPAKVRAGTITLNHDGGRWLEVGDQGSLPAVLESEDGQWRRE